MTLALEFESDRVGLGEPFAGHVNVLEGGPSRSLTLTVSFHEKTRDFNVIAYSSHLVLHEGDLVDGQRLDFRFAMPAEAPPSIKCEHSELYYEVAVASDEPGFDTHASRRIIVG